MAFLMPFISSFVHFVMELRHVGFSSNSVTENSPLFNLKVS
jgi:site-specific recombinase